MRGGSHIRVDEPLVLRLLCPDYLEVRPQSLQPPTLSSWRRFTVMETDSHAECSALQEDELVVLDSIYPSLCTPLPTSGTKGRLLALHIPITLDAPTAVQLSAAFRSDRHDAGPSSGLTLTHLPALSFRIALPPSYPLHQPPMIVSTRAALEGGGSWLSQKHLRRIGDRLVEVWREEHDGMGSQGVLWRWWEWIGHGDFLVDFGLLRDSVLT